MDIIYFFLVAVTFSNPEPLRWWGTERQFEGQPLADCVHEDEASGLSYQIVFSLNQSSGVPRRLKLRLRL